MGKFLKNQESKRSVKNWSNQSKINENWEKDNFEKSFSFNFLFTFQFFFICSKLYFEINKGLHIKVYICSIINLLLLIFLSCWACIMALYAFLKIYPCIFMLIYYLIYNIKIIILLI